MIDLTPTAPHVVALVNAVRLLEDNAALRYADDLPRLELEHTALLFAGVVSQLVRHLEPFGGEPLDVWLRRVGEMGAAGA